MKTKRERHIFHQDKLDLMKYKLSNTDWTPITLLNDVNENFSGFLAIPTFFMEKYTKKNIIMTGKYSKPEWINNHI